VFCLAEGFTRFIWPFFVCPHQPSRDDVNYRELVFQIFIRTTTMRLIPALQSCPACLCINKL
jgi:hypothetical protein